MNFTMFLVLTPIIASNVFFALEMQQTPVDPMLGAYGWPAIVGQIILFLTTVAGFAYTLFREKRNRQWDLEDRMRARDELAAKVEQQQRELAIKVEQQQRELAVTVDAAAKKVVQVQQRTAQLSTERQDALTQKIEESITVSRDAHEKSNSMNEKIAKLSAIYDSLTEKPVNSDTVEQIKETGEDTNVCVKSVDEAVKNR